MTVAVWDTVLAPAGPAGNGPPRLFTVTIPPDVYAAAMALSTTAARRTALLAYVRAELRRMYAAWAATPVVVEASTTVADTLLGSATITL